MSVTYTPPTYLSCAETAKLLRVALKKEFPGVKFSVRSSSYAGGASIDISWTDGPTAKDVERDAGVYAGADFDGSIDLKTYNRHWLEQDGTVHIAHAEGTEGSRGYLPEVIGDPIGPQAEIVRFGADFVFCERDISDEWQSEILDHFERVIGRTIDRSDEWTMWSQQVPLAVRRYGDDAGELLHMVESETEDLGIVFRQYTSFRTR